MLSSQSPNTSTMTINTEKRNGLIRRLFKKKKNDIPPLSQQYTGSNTSGEADNPELAKLYQLISPSQVPSRKRTLLEQHQKIQHSLPAPPTLDSYPFQQQSWSDDGSDCHSGSDDDEDQNDVEENHDLDDQDKGIIPNHSSSSSTNDKKMNFLKQLKVQMKNNNKLSDALSKSHSGDDDQKQTMESKSTNNQNRNKTIHSSKKRSNKNKRKVKKSTRLTDAEKMLLSRSALSRPFGRTSLPSHLAKQYCAEVSPFYDSSSKCWKYHILVQREEYTTVNNAFLSPVRTAKSIKNNDNISSPNSVMQPPTGSASPSQSPSRDHNSLNKSFTTANAVRTLKDIVWLERALRDEYHGALIFPALSMTLTSGTDWTTAVKMDKESFERGEWDPFTLSNELLDVVLEEEGFHDLDDVQEGEEKRPPFDPKLIADWFNDILNGVRGKGEVILNYSNSRVVDIMKSDAMESFFYKINEPLVDLHFMKKKEPKRNWLPINLDLSRLPFKDSSDDYDDHDDLRKYTMNGLMTFPILCLNNVCNVDDDTGSSDSILSRRYKHAKQQRPEFWQNSLLSDELKTQSYYIGLQRENTLRAMYRLRILLETEALVSTAWKRFAISLSNLFTAEKDIESCKVGDSTMKKSNSIAKEKVDDCLRSLARQKVDRATPSLKVLSGMLSAYYADFSAVNPSLRACADGLKQLKSEKVSITSNSDDNWAVALKAVSPLTCFQDPATVKDSHTLEMEMRIFEQRQSFNERLMKSSLLQLCKSINIRVSRMSWKYFKMESGQASLLCNAAKQTCETLGKEFYKDPSSEVYENEDEIDLVKRLLDLGLKRKYKVSQQLKSCSSSHTGSESDLISENAESLMEESAFENSSTQNVIIEKIVETTKKQAGRWDSKLTLSILKVMGDENPEINFENCTREVRTVQRLAESLRAQIDRCYEAIAMLKEIAHVDVAGPLTEHRKNFLSDLAIVLSGSTYSKRNLPFDDSDFETTLSNLGVNCEDTAGWLTLTDNNGDCIDGDINCGNVASKYQEIRDFGTRRFFEKMNDFLMEQRGRVERMESFVHMNYLATQMEKHFSNQRAESLAAWEKKTDITTAINIATKKRLPLLVNELKAKLETLSDISHTVVKEAKERHLGSKSLKMELEALAAGQWLKVREFSTHGVVKAISMWAEHEETVATGEIEALSEVINEIEKCLQLDEKMIEADGGAHMFATSGIC